MRRRIVWATAVLAVLLVVPSSPASAAEVRFLQPDGDVTAATPIEVRVDKGPAEPVHRAHLSLVQDGERVGETVEMDCTRGCEDSDARRIYNLPEDGEFDPATRAPFAEDTPLANGPYRLRVELDRGRFFDPETFHEDVHLAVPPTAPGSVRAETDGREVALTWARSPEPDIEGYRVERQDGDDWEELTTTTSTRFADEPGEGTHRYRVVAKRSDGRDGTLETASAERKVEVDGTTRLAAEDEADDDGADDNGAENGDEATDEADEDRTGSSQSSGTTRSGSSGTTAPNVGSNRSGAIPGVGQRGEGEDGYDTELDYGAMGEGADDVRVANPGGWRGTMDRLFDAERLAVPIAAGLVMTGMGLHLWRWLRVPLS
jgi:hypothetical protein